MNNRNVLIVEDNIDHAELTAIAIRKTRLGNRIDIVDDGEKALDYLHNRGEFADGEKYPAPALVLLDINLPGINGIEVLKDIKSDPALMSVIVIMLTTSDRDEDVKDAYRNNANSYLTKPVGHENFMRKIADLKHYWFHVNEMPPE